MEKGACDVRPRKKIDLTCKSAFGADGAFGRLKRENSSLQLLGHCPHKIIGSTCSFPQVYDCVKDDEELNEFINARRQQQVD